MNEDLYLRCVASSGQFGDEVAIKGTDHGGETFSFFANRRFVLLDADPALGETAALVQVVELDREGGLVLVRLPGQTFNNGCTITVKESELEQRSASLQS